MRLNKAFERVQQQLHKDWSIDSLASLIPCSAPHLHRLCQQYFGHSPKVHLTRMRMEYAARLLSATDWPIQQVSEIVGYPNPANFSTRFKTWSEMTPRQYRGANLSL
jgi:AraC-like DNA-binding protein